MSILQLRAADQPKADVSRVLARLQDRASPADRNLWIERFRAVRTETERRAAPLSPEDQVTQSMPDASPTKWHRAHTTWFFEQFVLRAFDPEYQPFNERFAYLFNSYYVAAGPRHARPQRGLITRPGAEEVAAYRAHVDRAIATLLVDANEDDLGNIIPVIEIGLHHEQQHQELLFTDILHAFAQNPTLPTYDSRWAPQPMPRVENRWVDLPFGIVQVGHSGDGFAYDNEGPAHKTLIEPVQIASRLITNGEWLEFMRAGGYAEPSLWLSDGWALVQSEGWSAPNYWVERNGAWHVLTLGGLRPVDPAAPVCHVSYYEADAFARWADCELPTEFEWEMAARSGALADAFGVVWQWTRSAYLPYPGYRAAGGALGEYNGKFMINQMVLRGSSLATPEGHTRVTYRNFFGPAARWQFTGLRLARRGGSTGTTGPEVAQ